MTYAVHLPNSPKADAREAYLEAWQTIDAQGLRYPAGRRLHVSWLAGDVLNVVDLWDSLDQQQSFMRRLGPILDEFGMHLDGPPRVGELLMVVEPDR